MSDLLPGGLRLLAALLTAGFVTTLSLAGYQLYLRLQRSWLAQAEVNALLAGAEGGMLSPVRRTVIALLAALNLRWVPEKLLRQVANALRRAGRPGDLEPAELVAWMELSALAFLGAGVAVSARLGFSPAWALLFTVFGACYPPIWLHDRIRQRHFAITRALPWDLDLLTLSVEAGLDFAAALGKVVEKGRKGPLREELSIVLKELRLGKTREEALRNLARRVELPALTSFAGALIQADRMGTPLGKVLRILSTQMRVERTQRAEKLANQAPVKLLLPLIGFIFPTIFIMLFGPIAYQVLFGGSF